MLWLTVSIPVNALAAGRTEDGAIAIAEETELPGETAAEGTETLPEEALPAEHSPEEAAPLSQANFGTCGDNLTRTQQQLILR